jgi:hypothetical protein
MPKAVAKDPLAALRSKLAKPVSFDVVCEKLGPKGKLNAERHLLACEAGTHGAAHAALWKQLACTLMTLAEHAAKFNGQQSIQFYVADGKYRMQVFALEDLRDGNVTVYCQDCLDLAVSADLVTRSGSSGNQYTLESGGDTLSIDRLDRTTSNPADFFKDMLGWNRKALRISLSATSTPAQVRAAELLCAMSVEPKAKAG